MDTIVRECVECGCEKDCIEGICLECRLGEIEIKKCFNWIKKLRVACPYCVAICEYDELVDKVKCEKDEIIKCKKCNESFMLADKQE